MNWWAITLSETMCPFPYAVTAGELRWVFTEHQEDAIFILEHFTNYKKDEIIEIELYKYPSNNMIADAKQKGDGIYLFIWEINGSNNDGSDYIAVNLRKIFIDNYCQHLLK